MKDDKAQVIAAIELALDELVAVGGEVQVVINEHAAMQKINGHWGYYTTAVDGCTLCVLDMVEPMALATLMVAVSGYRVVQAQGGDWVGMQPVLYEPPQQLKLL